jgi:hypothetical protein
MNTPGIAVTAVASANPDHQGGQRRGFDERSARGANRDLLARATAETQTHANSAKAQDRHLMIAELMLDTY